MIPFHVARDTTTQCPAAIPGGDKTPLFNKYRIISAH